MNASPRWLRFVVGAGVLAAGEAVRRYFKLGRRSARSDFHVTATRRMVAVGLPDAHSVRIWVRSDRPGPHVLEVAGPAGVAVGAFPVPPEPLLDGTTVVRWPADVGAEPLAPSTTYTFRALTAGGELVGDGRFTTAPIDEASAPDHFSVAIASCHQPFTNAGRLRQESLRLLDVLEPAFEAAAVQQILFLGDQMYTDMPAGHCLFEPDHFARVAPPGRKSLEECTRAEVRRLLQERYRIFWKPQGFRRLHARWPTVCMLDDHEVIDNFGSDPAHAGEAFSAFREGALDAFHDYQALRNHDRGEGRPEAFCTRYAWGPLAALILDLRSQRRADDERIQIFAESQWNLLDRFLAEEGERPVLILGLSVPIVHAPEWLIACGAAVAPEGSNVHDRWSHPKACAELDRLVHALHAHRQRHPHQQVVIVSGDVHVGAVSEITWDDAPPVLQLVSSAVSNVEQRLGRVASEALLEARPTHHTREGLRLEAALLRGIEGASENPFPGLNAGLVELRRDGGRWRVRLKLVGHDDADPPGPRVVFDSGEL